jgi:murein DD-endopeptidase MepM/ murein hydrolase activator NlpD
MRIWIACLAAAAFAQDLSVTPQAVPQGGTFKVRGGAAAQARFNGITIPLFPQPGGGAFGLMPVRPDQAPGEYTLELLNAGGAVAGSVTVAVRDAHFAKQNIVMSQALSGLEASPEEGSLVRAFLEKASPARFWEEPLQLPVRGCMTSPFGVERLRNGKPTGDRHLGIDQRSPMSAPIRAVAAGMVRIARQFELRGGTVAIDHGQGLESMYMHMSKVAAVEGSRVQAGDVIGHIGSTGRSTGPHLHWSLYANGRAVNPAQWVTLQACAAARAPARKRSGKQTVH